MLPEFRIVPVGLTSWKIQIKSGENITYTNTGWLSQPRRTVEDIWEDAWRLEGGITLISSGARPSQRFKYWDDSDAERGFKPAWTANNYHMCQFNTEKECEQAIDKYLNMLKDTHNKEEAIRHRLATVKPRRYP